MKFPKPQTEPNPEQALAKALADADHWGRIAADPNLSPMAAAWAFNVARSARAKAQPCGGRPCSGREARDRADQMTMLRGLLNPGAPTPSPPPSSDPTTPEL